MPAESVTENLEQLAFEDILARLEKVVSRLEAGDAPLEDALAIFEQGVALSRAGNQRLDDAERRIEELLDDGATAPLAQEADGADTPPAPKRTRATRKKETQSDE